MDKYVFADGTALPYIASRQNGRIVASSRLGEKKHRDKTGLFLAEGEKLTDEAIACALAAELYIRESGAERYASLVRRAVDGSVDCFVVSDAAFDKLTTEKSPQGVISLVHRRELVSTLPKGGNILLLDSVRDPGNLGTIMRSACALGNVSVALFSCADPYAPRAVRAAMGALFKLDILETDSPTELLADCRADGRRVIGAALHTDSLSLGEYECGERDVIVIGNEGHGISPEVSEMCDAFVTIPMNENTESLNAAAAASVILWEYARGHRSK